MAKPKHQKPKPSKQSKRCQSKKGGNQADTLSEMRVQLDILGLKIIQVTADGNCFFRALADQLEGNEGEHEKYRKMVVGFIANNREMFEPFVEDDISFDEYCRSIGEDGTWAGNMELQAASLVTRINICIHRYMSPRWYVQNFDIDEAQMVHLCYHDGEHYNSVRSKDDNRSGPAFPTVIKGDGNLSAKSNKPKATVTKSQHKSGGAKSIAMVMNGSGCEDTRKVEQALQEVDGDVDAAIEVLIAEEESAALSIYGDKFSHAGISSYGENQIESSDPSLSKSKENTCQQDIEKEKIVTQGHPADEKKISRNKACPCGSKKKYKSCCGSGVGKFSGRSPVNQLEDSGRSQKDKRERRKARPTVDSMGSDAELLDMGALCI